MKTHFNSKKLKATFIFEGHPDGRMSMQVPETGAWLPVCRGGRTTGQPRTFPPGNRKEFERITHGWFLEYQRGAQAPDQSNQKSRDFQRLWRETSPDYRGALPDGTLAIMGHAKYHRNGSAVVTSESITDEELYERLGEIEAEHADPGKGIAQKLAPSM